MKRRNLRRALGQVQRLEDRRLLAADLSAIDLAPVENFEPEICQVADIDPQGVVEDQAEMLDLDTTEVQTDVQDVLDVQDGVDPQVEVEVNVSDQVEDSIHDLGDPVDGVDGFFGSINAENPSQTLTFSPSEDGLIDVVVASSFGGHNTRLDVSNANGDVVASTVTEDLSGFQVLSFEAEAGESFELNVASEEGAEGYFQVTVGHSETPEPVDLHADSTGEDSTLLEIVDGSSELTGDLELAGDIDTFRFTADANGSVALDLAELNAENSTELEIRVTDQSGQQLSRGITNETVGVSFDVESGNEYFIAISAGEGQTGSYELQLTLDADIVEANETLDQETDVSEVVDNDVNDGEVTGDPVVEDDGLDVVEEDAEIVDVDLADEVIVDVADNSEADLDGQIPVEILDTVEEVTVADIVDSIPESFEPEVDLVDVGTEEDDATVAIVEDATEVDLPVEDSLDSDLPVDFDPIDESADEQMEVCFSDLESELDFADSFFAEFDPSSIFTLNDRYELRLRS